MEHSQENSELLLEDDIITPEEKEQIIQRIDNDLSSHHENVIDKKNFSAGSTGLLNSIITVFALIMISALLIILFNRYFIDPLSPSSIAKSEKSQIYQSEWEVLKQYIIDSTEKLDRKESEIQRYRIEISNYDRRLTTLKKLLDAKERIEAKITEERNTLMSNGIGEETIMNRITDFEKSLLMNLSPELAEINDSSIEEINDEIKKILSHKSKSEENLKQSEQEREILVREKEILQQNEAILVTQDASILEIFEKITILTEINNNYKEDLIRAQQITDLYSDIIISIESDERENALNKIDELQQVLQKQSNDSGSVSDRTQQNQIVSVLEKFTNQGDIFNSGRIEKTNNESSQQHMDSRKETGTDKKSPLFFIGVISVIDFNSLIIKASIETAIRENAEFYIYKKEDIKLENLLASGFISNISNDLVFGKLQSLTSTEKKLDPGDLVYIKYE